MMTINACSLCGSTDTHKCGDDFLCNECCTNIMSIPDNLTWLFDWLENKVLPYSIETKHKEK
jgi:hypothetical protein